MRRFLLDHRSPVPLYHQLAEAIRYRIATGEVRAGAVLPPLRRAAKLWGVNMHTVRRAYADLAAAGIAATSAPEGTRVLPGPVEPAARPDAAARDRFLRSIVSEARLEHGLSVEGLIGLLRPLKATPRRHAVSVVECSRTQCEDLAAQIGRRWRVEALPWVLGDREPPPGLVVGTYFHYNDIRLRWPERLPDVRFLPIAPEPDLAARLRPRAPGGGRRRRTVVLCERDDAMARNIAADLIRILVPEEFRVVTKVVAGAAGAPRAAGRDTPVLFSPRMWGELSPRARRDPRYHQVRYVFDSVALGALGDDQGWEAS